MKIDMAIQNIDKVICRHIANINQSSRGAIAQDILAQLRNLVEHIMLKIYACGSDIEITYKNICDAIQYVQTKGDLRILYRFHEFLQIVASHYTLDEENSERLMLKYYEYLYKIKKLVYEKYGIQILANLDNFPIHVDDSTNEYYSKIAVAIEKCSHKATMSRNKYYIQKIKPFFVNYKIFYEITFTPVMDHSSKFDRIIAFTDIDIIDNYSVKLCLQNESIDIMNNNMPLIIITAYEVAIRSCEYKNFISLVLGKSQNIPYSEQHLINQYLTSAGINLSAVLDFPESEFLKVMLQCSNNNNKRTSIFFETLQRCRQIVNKHMNGENILRYLLYQMRNKIIKYQMQSTANEKLSGLFLKNGTIPFERMPYISSPLDHNPKIGVLFDCIPAIGREHELLARFVKNNTEIKGTLFTKISDIVDFSNVQGLVEKYNSLLWQGHYNSSRLILENGQIFINGYKDDTCYIIETIRDLSLSGVQNYSDTVNAWLDSNASVVDCEEKKKALIQMYASSRAAVVYGSAGTGKSTLINHVAHFFASKKKLFLAQTNPAVDNLKRRVTASNCEFATIAKFLLEKKINTQYDLVVIDESSTVSNKDMRALLEKISLQLLLLVGDTFQISSIRFGNWFSTIKDFISPTSVFELMTPYRSKDMNLRTFWARVRAIDDTILELITRQGYSTSLDDSIFTQTDDDEIILCLNYDGLYGINNINRFLQANNHNPSTQWGLQQYKTGDPILFNESERFAPAIYNNMKGRIVNIATYSTGTLGEYIEFDIELTKTLNGIDAAGQDFELLSNNSQTGNSVIRFKVYKNRSTDDDDDSDSMSIMPFQVAYAISIHKAQGLEYNSVKIVITDEVDELITHNIFYTAVTRARSKLKIYWSPEVEHNVLSNIRPRTVTRDLGLLKKYIK